MVDVIDFKKRRKKGDRPSEKSDLELEVSRNLGNARFSFWMFNMGYFSMRCGQIIGLSGVCYGLFGSMLRRFDSNNATAIIGGTALFASVSVIEKYVDVLYRNVVETYIQAGEKYKEVQQSKQ